VDISGLSADVPRTYLRLTEDHCYPPELQEPSSKLVHGGEAFLPSGHMAMVSIPDQLASWLAGLA
jgi:hypothetical protein